MKRRIFAAALLAFAVPVLLLAAAQASKPALSVSDQFERAGAGQEIAGSGNFPHETAIYGEALPYTYPPLFDVFGAEAALMAGLDFALVWRALSFVLLAIIFTYSYKFSHSFLDRNFALCAAALAALLPWVFRRTAAAIPESVGLAMFVMLLYYVHKKNFLALAVLMPLLMLTHLRSFGTFAMIFLGVIAYWLFLRTWEIEEQRERVELMRKIALTFLPTLLLGAWWFLPKLDALSLRGTANPWVDVFDLTAMFSWLWAVALLPAAVLLWKNPKNLPNLVFVFGMVFALVFGGTVFGFRELAYLFFPIAFLCALLLQWIGGEISANLSLALFAAFALLLILQNLAWIQQESYFSERNLAAVKALDELPYAGERVLADYMLSYAVPLYTDKKVIIGAFMEGLPDGSARANAAYGFYTQCLANRRAVANYYPDIFGFTPYIRNAMHCSGDEFGGETARWNRIYDNGTTQWHSPAG
ncbi:MAG: hypothetical protein V1676_00965 [Candidatus Diapherotrites archaeon]